MSLDPHSRMLIEWQCTSLCHRVMYCIDTGDVDSLVNLFTEDAEIGSALGIIAGRGRDHIRSTFSSAPPGLVIRHVITDVHFVNVQEDHADAICYNTSYHSMGSDGENPFMTARLFELRDRYQRIGDRWLIRSRSSKMVFAPKDWMEESERLLRGTRDNG